MERCYNFKLAVNFLTFTALMSAPSAFGQFKKYESKPRFNSSNTKSATTPSPTSSTSNSNTQTFGQRTTAPAVDPEVKSKYVQLNPETAFGPEIVESFDFPDADIMEVTKHMQINWDKSYPRQRGIR